MTSGRQDGEDRGRDTTEGGVGHQSVLDFDRIHWDDGDEGFELDGQPFALEASHRDQADGLRFFKSRSMIEQYEALFGNCARPRTILELGIWQGGSAVFWAALARPDRYVAIDHSAGDDPPAMRKALDALGLTDVVTTRWGVDQRDGRRVHEILDELGTDRLDLILDDASHEYEHTVASFDWLFSRLRPGGWYVIEDWSWCYREPYARRDHPWAIKRSMAPFVHEIIGALGSMDGAIEQVRCFADLAAVQRGPGRLGVPDDVRGRVRARSRPWEKVAYRRAVLGYRSLRRRLRNALDG